MAQLRGASGGPCGGLIEENPDSQTAILTIRPARSDSSQPASSKVGAVHLVALGIDAQGNKHVLGLREGSTESTRVVRSLLSDLIERGLEADRARLWVIDGGKALRKAMVVRLPPNFGVHSSTPGENAGRGARE